MAFFLFLLVNATLFIRPAEVVPALLGWRIYEALIIVCFLAALPEIVAWITGRALDSQPITLCVFGLLVAAVLSHLTQMRAEEAMDVALEFVKLIVYYVLLVSVVNTPWRIRVFLAAIVVCCAALTIVAVLRYHDVLDIALPPPPKTLRPWEQPEDKAKAFVVERVWDPATQQTTLVRRLIGTGIFHDPNDFCFALVLGVALSGYWLTDARAGPARLLLLLVLGLFGYTLYLTQSRGGLLGVLAALGTLFYVRYGWRKSVAVMAVALPLIFLLYAGRMTSIVSGAREGTGQSRLQLWSDGLDMFRAAPLFGVGMNEYAKNSSHVAHNSFLHTFSELGLFGGLLYLGAFYFAVLALGRAGRPCTGFADREMWRLRPYLLALVVGSVVCMLSLTLCYILPTYLILGLVTAYTCYAVCLPVHRESVLRLDLALGGRLVLIGFGFLAATYLFVRLFRA